MNKSHKYIQQIALVAIGLFCGAICTYAGDREKQIDELMVISGTKGTMHHMTDQVVQGALSTSGGRSEAAKIISEAFPHDSFLDAMTLALEKNYDEKRYVKLIKTFSSSLAKQMTDIEKQQPSQVAVQQFMTQISKQPLPPHRMALISELDEVSGGSKLYSEITFSSLSAIALASAGECPAVKLDIKKKLAEKRNTIEKSTHSSILFMIAFVYRDVSDQDLSAYIDLQKEKDVMWFDHIQKDVILKQFKSGIEVMTEGFSKLVIASKAQQSMFTPKCGDKPDILSRDISKAEVTSKKQKKYTTISTSIPTKVAINNQTAHALDGGEKTKISLKQDRKSEQKLSGDARSCLDLNSDSKIIACADHYQ